MARLKNTSTLSLSPFEQQLKKVLKWFDKPDRVGCESPLASIYFLGGVPFEDAQSESRLGSERGRGELLCREIRRAAAALWPGPLPTTLEEMRAVLPEVRTDPGSSRYAYIVLELRCFQDFLRPKRTADIWLSEEYLPGSQSEHYRDYDAAVVQLGQALLERLDPSLRGERPPVTAPLVGYDAQIAELNAILAANQSVILHGPSGIGKSSVAAWVLQQLAQRPVFWYTVRPSLNDHLSALLFALGHFFHRHGVYTLWQLVLASGGTFDDYNLALGAVQSDLSALTPRVPVLCIDELDLLLSHEPIAVVDTEATAQMQVQRPFFAFLDGLAAETPLLLIGQTLVQPTAPFTGVQRLILPGLATPHILQLFHQVGALLRDDEAHALYRATGGNPRLLTFCLMLYQRGEPVKTLWETMAQDAALVPLLQRLWQLLSQSEQQLLQQLAVFRRPAPRDALASHERTVHELIQKRLLFADGQGGIELLPVLRNHIYQQLSSAEGRRYHRAAAEIRLLYAEYTAAAYHLVCGEQAPEAIQLWFVQRDREVRRGQANAAFALFHKLRPGGFGKAEDKALAIIQAELHKLRGELETGLQRLKPVAVDIGNGSETVTEATILIEGLRGEFLELLGEPDVALVHYDMALRTAGRILNRQVLLHQQRSMLYVRQRDFDAAQHEVNLADCHLTIVRGILADEAGDYEAAHKQFLMAWTEAAKLDEPAVLALAERHLANISGRLQDLPGAEQYAQQAIARYETLGDAFNVARVYDNLAFSYIHAGALQQGIDAAKQAWTFFQTAKSTYYSAVVATNLAEAYFDVGNLEQAEAYAHRVLESEERHPLPYALYTLGRIHESREQWDHASYSYAESKRLAVENQDRFMEAYARRALGRIVCELDQNWGEQHSGQKELRTALTLFQELGIKGEVAETERQIQALL